MVNSAGVMNVPERTLSEGGMEMHFATNHIGHFLFICSIMSKLIKVTEGSRVAKGYILFANVVITRLQYYLINNITFRVRVIITWSPLQM